MKRTKRLLALLLTAALILCVLSACGSSSEEAAELVETSETEEQSESPEESSESAEPAASETEAEPSETSAEEPVSESPSEEEAEAESEETPSEEPVSISYPLEGDDLELTYWMPFKSPHDSIQAFEDFPVLATAEELTGVTLTFVSESMMTATEKFNLMVASSDYCDLIGGALSYYTGNFDEAIEDGIAIDISGMIQEYAPDYYAMITADEDTYRATINDSGVMIAVYSIKDQYFPVMGSTVIRQDWLDALGYEAPTSLEELDEFLRACHDTYGAGYAIMLNYSNYLDLLSSALGIGGGDTSDGLYQVDGEVRYTYIQPEYKTYLELAAGWYADGIISNDFMSVGATGMPSETYAYVYSGDTAVISATAAEVASIESETGNGCTISAYNLPAEDGSGTTHFTDLSLVKSSEHAIISEQCENPEVALQWLNYWFTDYGALVANYGTEGESWTYDENNEPAWTDLVLNNEYDLPANRASAIYSLYAHTTPIHTLETRLASTFTEEEQAIYDVWLTGIDGERLLPAVTLTQEESEVARSPLADIQTYVEENVAKFINGTRSLDTFDDFVADIEGMGISDILEVYQAALDRYYERSVG